jgi:riboflavin kinase/FMN adenylyltransferase
MTILKYPENFEIHVDLEQFDGIIPCCLAPSRLFPESVIALGLFDGVHIGHRALLERAKDEAKSRGVKFGIFTFDTSSGVKGDVRRIYPDSEKLRIFEELGADFTVIADFEALKHQSPQTFVESVILEAIGASVAVSGFNFRFGRGASGDATVLGELMQEHGGEAITVQEITLDGITVSSTEIRRLILLGDMRKAERMLGAPYKIRGRVEEGDGRGSKLGFPTVNLPIAPGCALPRLGVYASRVTVGKKSHKSITNVGICPTFESREAHLECYIFDFEGDLYGKEISVELTEFLRDEREFSSKDELVLQISEDIKRANEV